MKKKYSRVKLYINLFSSFLISFTFLLIIGNGCSKATFKTFSDIKLQTPASTSGSESMASTVGPLSLADQRMPLSSNKSRQPAIRPLSPREYDKSILIIFGLSDNFGQSHLQASSGSLFDNESNNTIIDSVRVNSYEYAAGLVSEAFLKSITKNKFLACVPSSVKDTACFTSITLSWAYLAYRMPVVVSEVQDIITLAVTTATTENLMDAGIKVIIQTLLQDPRFLYRFEIGVSLNGKVKLDDYEFLSRLTFFALGSPPTKSQLDAVKSGVLNDPITKSNFVLQMLESSQFIEHMDLFHSYWMGYSELKNQSSMVVNFRNETKALIQRIITQNLKWDFLLRSTETYANKELAVLYGLDDIQTTDWIWRKYIKDSRQGLLSQGSFLSVGVKGGDTSITRRGINALSSLFCSKIGPAVSVDEDGSLIDPNLPPASPVTYRCREDLFKNTVLRKQSCVQCHSQTDSMAFGLENFSATGAYRSSEQNKPDCLISGQGSVQIMTASGNMLHVGDFFGAKGLQDLALETGFAPRCFVQRLLEFSMGRNMNISSDGALISNLVKMEKATGNFKDFLLAFIVSNEFSERVE